MKSLNFKICRVRISEILKKYKARLTISKVGNRQVVKCKKYFVHIAANVLFFKHAANASMFKYAIVDTLISVRFVEWTSPIAIGIFLYHIFKIWKRKGILNKAKKEETQASN